MLVAATIPSHSRACARPSKTMTPIREIATPPAPSSLDLAVTRSASPQAGQLILAGLNSPKDGWTESSARYEKLEFRQRGHDGPMCRLTPQVSGGALTYVTWHLYVTVRCSCLLGRICSPSRLERIARISYQKPRRQGSGNENFHRKSLLHDFHIYQRGAGHCIE